MKKQMHSLPLKLAPLTAALAMACDGAVLTRPNWEGMAVLGEYVVFEGVKRAYGLNVPSSYDESKPAPLVIMLHGGGDTGPNFQRWSNLDSLAESVGFITVFPNGTGYGCTDDLPIEECDDTPPYRWQSGDIDFVRELIGHLRSELTIDRNRIFAAGFSNGSIFTHIVGCEMADLVAGVAAISAPFEPRTATRCFPAMPIPVMYLHGTDDGSFPWNGDGPYLSAPSTASQWAAINECEEEPDLDWIPDTADDGTRVWTETYRDCAGGAEVLFYGVENGGHTWPGHPGFPSAFGLTTQDISVNLEMLKFFFMQGRF